MRGAVITSGGRFASDRLAREAAKDGRLKEYWIGVPRDRVPSVQGLVRPLLFPTAVWLVAQRIPRLARHPEIHHVLYDRLASRRVSRSDPPWLIHGLAGYSAETLTRGIAVGSRTVVDRACPHVDFQKSLLLAEAERVGAPRPSFAERVEEMMRAEYRTADAIVVPSNYSARTFDQTDLRDKVRIVPLGVEGPDAPPTRRERTVREVLFVGGEPLRKGLKWILEAWRLLDPKDAVLKLRTEPPPWLAEDLARTNNVTVIPRLGADALQELYRSADVVLLPSIDDGFGMALFEGMINGAVGLCSTNVGAGELVEGPGIEKVSPGDPKELADALARILDAPDLTGRRIAAHEAVKPWTWSRYYLTMRDVWDHAGDRASTAA